MILNTIVSLFDGMGGAQLGINGARIKYKRYLASEIDRYAMQISKHHFPNTEYIGSITDVDTQSLPKVDLLIGGSPCQNFSFAGKQKGMSTKTKEEVTTLDRYLELKDKGFEFEGQSYLFWEYIRVLQDTKPKYFLLENVIMPKKWEDIITKTIGVDPIMINSSNVSAQNRKRLYWTNIPDVTQPKDYGILLKDIMEDLPATRPCMLREPRKNALCTHIANAMDISGNDQIKRIYHPDGKGPTLSTCQGGHREPKILGSSGGVTNQGCDLSSSEYIGKFFIPSNYGWRKLTPLECERLQTVPEGYTLMDENIGGRTTIPSQSQRYRMLGNGFTVDVISHILSFIK